MVYIIETSFSNKAVADGGVSFHLDHVVSARVAKYTYGTSCVVEFEAANLQHRQRQHTVTLRPSGKLFIPNAFSAILQKVIKISRSGRRIHMPFRELKCLRKRNFGSHSTWSPPLHRSSILFQRRFSVITVMLQFLNGRIWNLVSRPVRMHTVTDRYTGMQKPSPCCAPSQLIRQKWLAR
jgi:hypothetical protein